jgi:tetratricopeptide (TPR) repeat protein
MTNLPVPRQAPSRRRKLLVLLGGLLLLVGAAGLAWRVWRPPPPPKPPEVPLDSVIAEIREVINEARAVVVSDPQSAHAWGHLGKVLLVNGFADRSVVCFEQAARLAPEQPRWPYYLAMYYWQVAPEKARAHLERAAELCERSDPDNLEPRFRLVELLLETGDLEGASEAMKPLIDQVPDHPRLRYNRGVLACRRQQWQQAREWFEPLAAVPEVRQRSLAQLILVANRLGREELAERYERQQAAAPADRGWQDRFEQEVGELDVGRRLRPPQGNSGDAEQALQTLLARAREEGRNDPGVYLALGNLFLQQGRLDEAEKAVLRAVELGAENARTFGMRGWIAFRRAENLERGGLTREAQQRFEEAVGLLRQAIRLSDQEAMLHYPLGASLRALGRPEEALPALRKAAQLSPEIAEIQLGLAEGLAALDRKQEALEHLQRAVRCAGPGNPLPAQKLKEYRQKWKIEKP